MTDDARREEVVKRRIRHVLPAREPWGLPLYELNLVIKKALDERERRGLSNEFMDSLRFIAEDGEGGEIVIFYDVDEPAIVKADATEPPFLEPCPHVDEHAVVICWPGQMEHLREDKRMRLVVHCCLRPICQARIAQLVREITGHQPSIEQYPTP